MGFDLTILGSGSALPTIKRFSTAHLLNVSERFFLFDCAEGTQIQLKKAKCKFGKLNHIFISHLHGDHLFGIFGLLSTFELLDRKQELNIFAPEQFKNILTFYHSNFGAQQSFKINFIPLPNSLETILDDKKATVKSFPLTHKVPCYGFITEENPRKLNIKKSAIEEYNISVSAIHRIIQGEDFKTSSGEIISNKQLTLPPFKPRKYVFITDTIAKKYVIEHIAEADILYHEATFSHKDLALARTTCHSTSIQAAEIAREANVKKLLIGHFSTRYKNVEPLINEAREIFPETYAVNDLERFKIEAERQQ